jgi:PD-(D/E)XK nuclease superfamily
MTDTLDIPDYLKRTKDNKMPAQFAKPLVYSYTLLKTADTCLYKCYRQYIKRDLPFDKTPEIDWGNKVHEAMEYRLGGKPLPGAVLNDDGTVKWPSMQHWEPLAVVYVERQARPEKKTGITKEGKPTGFFDKDVWLRCKIDATMLRGANVFLADWKTGSSRYEDPFELEIQALTLKAAIPAITRVGGHYVWLKENRVGEPHDLSDFTATWAKVNNKVEVIEDCQASGEWPKTKNPLCGWCGVLDCENNPKRTV